MKCPYGNHENKSVVRQGDKFSVCPICGKSAIVTTYAKVDGIYQYSLSKIGRYVSTDPKKVRTVRLSDSEMNSLEKGLLRLVVVNKRITVTV